MASEKVLILIVRMCGIMAWNGRVGFAAAVACAYFGPFLKGSLTRTCAYGRASAVSLRLRQDYHSALPLIVIADL